MVWLILIVAGLMETVWAAALEKSQRFTKLWPTVLFLVALAASMGGLGHSLRELPLGTAYAVWVGIGAVGTAVFGMVWLHEPATAGRLVCLALILVGVVGLKILTH
ncbi:multidrug efflux SMR transporter [Actinomadura fulvescens]|uniref:Quaternary ammonium compound efflux SMR transporter SugE n=1 Tax=Actinomadura fulvescens TaxID=46160 RepID=A0ABN3PPJ6_9ACTN